MPGRSADPCQIIQHCLSPELGKRRLIHPRQLRGAAEWDPRGGGRELRAFVGKCYFCSVDSVAHRWHSGALFHPSQIPLAAEQRAEGEGLSKGLVTGGDGKPLCRHVTPLCWPPQLLTGASDGADERSWQRRGRFFRLWAKFTPTAIPGAISEARGVLQSILQIRMATGGET